MIRAVTIRKMAVDDVDDPLREVHEERWNN